MKSIPPWAITCPAAIGCCKIQLMRPEKHDINRIYRGGECQSGLGRVAGVGSQQVCWIGMNKMFLQLGVNHKTFTGSAFRGDVKELKVNVWKTKQFFTAAIVSYQWMSWQCISKIYKMYPTAHQLIASLDKCSPALMIFFLTISILQHTKWQHYISFRKCCSIALQKRLALYF